jgi:alcohol dehydrogenase class IV
LPVRGRSRSGDGLADHGKTPRQTANEVVEEICFLSDELRILQRLREVGVNQEDLRGMMQVAFQENRLLIYNPRNFYEFIN